MRGDGREYSRRREEKGERGEGSGKKRRELERRCERDKKGARWVRGEKGETEDKGERKRESVDKGGRRGERVCIYKREREED